MADRYALPDGYVARAKPEYFDDTSVDIIWQPDVYECAAEVARRLEVKTIVDLGCGAGTKLTALLDEFSVIGVDYGPNIERCRKAHSRGEWIEHDFDSTPPLNLDKPRGALLICADVLEHLAYPERLLMTIRKALDEGAIAAILSTPDRALYYGTSQLGPPPNPSHVREWRREEFRRFLELEGLYPIIGLTRSNSASFRMQTILAIVPRPGDEEPVLAWWREHQDGQALAAQHEEALSDLEQALDTHQREIAAHEDEIRATLETHQREIAAHEDEIRATLETHQGEIALLEARIASSDDALARLETEVSRLETELAESLAREAEPARRPRVSLNPLQHRDVRRSLYLTSRGGQILLTQGPRAFSRAFADWRVRHANPTELAPPGEPASILVLGADTEQVSIPDHLATQHLPDDGFQPDVTIVIVVWNALPFARACLESVLAVATNHSFEVVVIDNGSQLDVLSWLNAEHASSTTVRFLRLPANVGFARGVNVGVRLARGRYIAVLNSDTLVTGGWVDLLITALEQDPSLGIVSPVTNYVGEGLQIDSAARDLRPDQIAAYAESIRARSHVLHPPERLAFFCVAMRRELFDRLNGLDEGFGLGNFEDEEHLFPRPTPQQTSRCCHEQLRISSWQQDLRREQRGSQRLDGAQPQPLH